MGMARRWHRESGCSENRSGRLAEDRMIERIFKKILTAEIIGNVLVFMALLILVFGITFSLNNPDPTYFLVASLVATWISLELSKRNSRPIPASAGLVALGGIGVWILGASLSIPLINLFKASIAVIPPFLSQTFAQISYWVQTQIIHTTTTIEPPVSQIDTSAILQAWQVIVEASSTLAQRFQAWFVGWQQNIHVNDVLVRNLIWLFVLWLISAWMGWFTAKRKAVLVLAPAMILLAMVIPYLNSKAQTLCGLVVILLLLMGVWNYKSNLQQWENHKIDYSESIIYDNTQAVLVLALVVGVVAFITPSISWREIRDKLREQRQSNSQISDALGIQKPTAAPTKKVNTPIGVLPREHLLGGEISKSRTVVMTIRTGELQPMPEQAIHTSVPSYYWRSVVYDDYVGTGWITTSFVPQSYSPNTPVIPGLLNGYKPLHLDIQLAQPSDQLFWSGTLFSANVPMTVDWRVKPPSDLFADRSTLIQADMFTAASKVTSYHADSYVPDITVQQLRTAPIIYTDAIRDQYLELPSSLPDRVVQLAKQVAEKGTNPYDKAKAIETYLRAYYKYDTEVPQPPPDKDVADYFLFTLQRGYCDYYATAMVVMARANGIPARFVSGYSPGEYDSLKAEYVIREMNAHSWAEVYFPTIGWVEFEPTSSIPEVVHKEKENITSTTQQPQADKTISNLLLRFRLIKVSYIVLPILAILFGWILYFTVIERWRYASLAPAIAIDIIYRKFYGAGRPLVGERTSAETSQEFTDKLTAALNHKQAQSRFKKYYARIQSEVMLLTAIYQSMLFRNIQTQKKDFATVWRAWTSLRWRLWFTRITSINLKEKIYSLPLFQFFARVRQRLIKRSVTVQP
jgi:transglutaminase-like putative cysteine protease